MLVIRKEQMQVFGDQMRNRYEERLAAHMTKLFPERCAALGEEGLRAEIRYGVDRAGQYDITTERDVSRYVEFMLRWGRDFETKPATAWTHPILSDRSSNAENRLRRVAWIASKRPQTTASIASVKGTKA